MNIYIYIYILYIYIYPVISNNNGISQKKSVGQDTK